MLMALGVAFVGGMFSLLAPCSLPVLPAYFAALSRAKKNDTFMPTVYFGLGLAMVFTLFGLVAGSIGAYLSHLRIIIGEFFGIFIIGMGILLLIGNNLPQLHLNYVPKASRTSMFLFGMVFGISWTSCIGPILGSILVLSAANGKVLMGGILLFVFALGLIVPLMVLSAYLEKINKNGLFWRIMRGHEYTFHIGKRTLTIHSTMALSGILLIVLGFLLLTGGTTYLLGVSEGWLDWDYKVQTTLLRWWKP